jgi:hypothetical protein
MDDAKIKQMFATLTEQFINATSQLSALKASVNVLKAALATQLNPENPLEVLKFFQAQETRFLNADPQEQARKQAAETIEAMKIWKSGGKHEA